MRVGESLSRHTSSPWGIFSFPRELIQVLGAHVHHSCLHPLSVGWQQTAPCRLPMAASGQGAALLFPSTPSSILAPSSDPRLNWGGGVLREAAVPT